jgi:hypothetical protein
LLSALRGNRAPWRRRKNLGAGTAGTSVRIQGFMGTRSASSRDLPGSVALDA